MISEVDYAGLATLIAAITAAIVTIIGAMRTGSNGRGIEQVHQEVRTMNALTMGGLADAGETRRIGLIPVGDRTQEETEHITAIPLPALVDKERVEHQTVEKQEVVPPIQPTGDTPKA